MKHIKLFEQYIAEAKDNLYLQLHKKYAEQIKGLKAGKIKKLTDLVSVQRWSMEDREDYFGMDSKKKKELSAEYNEERKLFKKYIAGDESVMLPKGTEALPESVVNEAKVDKKYFDKVVKVLGKSKYPFTIMLVSKWDEIDIVIGYDAPDDISDDIDQRLSKAKLNWGGSSGISISGDSSNYSRREYDEIARINGGHKDY